MNSRRGDTTALLHIFSMFDNILQKIGKQILI